MPQPDVQSASTSSRIQPPSPTVFVPDTPPVKKSSKAPKSGANISPSAHRAHKTFAAIDADDDPLTDSDDDTPLSVIGKRARTPTSANAEEAGRPVRRLVSDSGYHSYLVLRRL